MLPSARKKGMQKNLATILFGIVAGVFFVVYIASPIRAIPQNAQALFVMEDCSFTEDALVKVQSGTFILPIHSGKEFRRRICQRTLRQIIAEAPWLSPFPDYFLCNRLSMESEQYLAEHSIEIVPYKTRW